MENQSGIEYYSWWRYFCKERRH